MSLSTYLVAVERSDDLLPSESTADLSGALAGAAYPLPGRPEDMIQPGFVFEIADYSFDVAQSLSLGSGTGAWAGAGKPSFNPLSLTLPVDKSSSTFFHNLCAGLSFKFVDLLVLKDDGTGPSVLFLVYGFGNVVGSTMSFAFDDAALKQTISLPYTQAHIAYRAQNPDGSYGPFVSKGWDRATNKAL